MSQFADYSVIDRTLNKWAQRNGLRWATDYKGWDVRSFSWPLAGTESVQLWVDPPEDSSAFVNVALNSSSDARRKTQKASYGFEALETGLDAALCTALQWKNDANASN